jgi:hypothetical protein
MRTHPIVGHPGSAARRTYFRASGGLDPHATVVQGLETQAPC